jgi:hypothetical protein
MPAMAEANGLAKLAVLTALLLLGGSVSGAQPRKAAPAARHGANAPAANLSPEAEALANARKNWPGVPLCDEGGYRILPCSRGGGGGG